MKQLILIVAVIIAAALGGCAQAPYENPIQAVTYQSDHIAMAVRSTYASVAVLPFVNDSKYVSASLFARRSFFGQLASRKNYALQPMHVTDALLKTLPRSALDPRNAVALGKTLKTDLIVFGEVKEELHTWGLVYAKTFVLAKISFVDAKDGREVWMSEDSRARLTGGIDPFAMIVSYDTEYMWAREVLNRYDELFRDMMEAVPDCTVEWKHVAPVMNTKKL